ncbi:MAG: outer membrane lipoprotein-sorting protein [bacterium]
MMFFKKSTIYIWAFFSIPALIFGADGLNAQEILKKTDDVLLSAKDQQMVMKIIILDKKGNIKEREVLIYQKGDDRRLAKIISPADQRGIGFLSLPKGLIYVYLPAYKKVRRIASHVKNNKFAGTDFTYEDMEPKRYSSQWLAQLLDANDTIYILKLVPQEETNSEYSSLVMYVDKFNFYPKKIEYFDKKGNMVKTMMNLKTEKIDGYYVAREAEMVDLRTDNRTRISLDSIKFDSGIADDIFTERFLTK